MKLISLIFLIIISLSACKEAPTPKPHGYLRIDMPEHSYKAIGETLPFTFEQAQIAQLERVRSSVKHRKDVQWYNLHYKKYNAKIHLSYIPVTNNLDSLHEESHEFVFEHTIKADAIDEMLINKPQEKVFGLLYDLQGNTASNMEFYVSDSTSHFLRGALYFETTPNIDSLAPIVDFIKKDIIHLINTLEWNVTNP